MSAVAKFEEDFFPPEKIQVYKETIGKDLSTEELKLFAEVCRSVKLNPFIKQIYAIKRRMRDKNENWVYTMTIQTGIDGLRSIAERTGMYAPGKETTYVYNKDGNIISATAYVKKMTPDGTWHEVSATAFWNEYCVDKNPFWRDKPHIMIGKCAEALCIRKAFPSVTGNLYIAEEMGRAGETVNAQDIIQTNGMTAEGQIIDSRANEGHSDRSEKRESIDILKSNLKRDNISIDRLEDYIKRRCEIKQSTPSLIVGAALDVYPNFRDWYVDWLHTPGSLAEGITPMERYG